MSRKHQRGFSLLEMAMALAIAGLVLSGTLTLVTSVQNSGNNRQIAADIITIGKATQHYIALNRTQLLGLTALNAIGNVEEIRVLDADSGNTTANSLVTSGVLPTTFPVQNLKGQNYRVLVKRLDDSTAGFGDTDMLVAMVYTYGGTSFSDKEGSTIAGQIGAAGGFIYSDDTSHFNGTLGYWQEAASDWSGTWAAPAAGHVAISTAMLAIDIPGEDGGAREIDDLSDGVTFYSPNKSLYMGEGSGSITPTGSNNTAAGYLALENASGSDSVAIGIRAGQTSTSKDVYVGDGVGALNTGSSNTAFGTASMSNPNIITKTVTLGRNSFLDTSSLSSSENVAIGEHSLRGNFIMDYAFNRTTAIGRFILSSGTSSYDNTIIGNTALSLAQAISESVITGDSVLSGANPSTGTMTGNVVLGNNILTAGSVTNLTFNYNTIISDVTACNISTPTASVINTTVLGTCGTLSSEADQTYFETGKVLASGPIQIGTTITTASGITLGTMARTTDSLSIAIGYAASLGGTSSRYVSFGYGAGGNAGLSSSVAIGNGASGGSGISSNTYSVQLGAGSGAVTSVVGARANNTLLSYRSGYNMSTGQNNIIVGNIAGITTGSNNIVLHQEPSTSTGTLTLANQSDLLQLTPAIRGNLSSRYIVMGGAGTETVGGSLTGMSLYVPDGGIRAAGYYYTSDRTLKKNITPFVISDSLLRRLKPVTYSLKADSTHKMHIGFIAQEVSELIPEAVTKSGPLMGISYGTMSVPLVSLIQHNEDKIRNLSAALSQVNMLENLLEAPP